MVLQQEPVQPKLKKPVYPTIFLIDENVEFSTIKDYKQYKNKL